MSFLLLNDNCLNLNGSKNLIFSPSVNMTAIIDFTPISISKIQEGW